MKTEAYGHDRRTHDSFVRRAGIAATRPVFVRCKSGGFLEHTVKVLSGAVTQRSSYLLGR